MYAVILAGGEGTRLWPLSRPDRPKPFLDLLGSTSLLQRTVARLAPLIETPDVHVVTDRRYAPLVHEQVADLPAGNVLGEPFGRNTAAAIALAAVAIDRPDDEVMVVLPADQQVLDEPSFRAALAAAGTLAAAGGLVTLGIAPTGPETGYGYIVASPPGREVEGRQAFAVDRFVEKPDLAGAKALLATGLAAWNSGIFVWTRGAITEALARHAPDILDPIRAALAPITPGAGAAIAASGARSNALDAAYPSLRARSIDYAVMEPASLAGEVAVIPIDVGWSDLGSWSALRDAWLAEAALAEAALSGGGPDGTEAPGPRVVGTGRRRDIDSVDCLVMAGERLVVTIGLSDVIVVDTPDALLVCAADRSQDVRQIAAELASLREDRS